ncbi:MAG TPA: peptidyl-alpha-hydroxyglycine alpha-amidating lyase family protein [Vicinamibacterales bacterium]|nr:peptidyl-alpha-hydroxyglycine alpha-amidating lyase family protein [Vicinamibacterales bacterium]
MPRTASPAALVGVILITATLAAQSPVAPANDAPNPYETIEGWARMPEGRTWGSTSAVAIAADGVSVWVAERCGANSCWDAAAGQASPLDVVLLFDQGGQRVRSFGAGMFVFPHGIHVDGDGNVWVTDGRDNLPRRPARGTAANTPLPPPPANVIGHQVLKFSPTGQLLLALGKAGGNAPGQPYDEASLYQPNDVITNAAGEIFVAEGHSSSAGATARIVKFDRQGRFLKTWGSFGTEPGQFDQPHGLAFDSEGRLFVADRGNNRIQIFDQEGNLLDHGWEQYSRLSGIWIDQNDMLYGADSESGSVAPTRSEWKRGIRIGSIREGRHGKIHAFIPDPFEPPAGERARGTLAAEGVAVDRNGVIYGAEVGPKALKRYVRR